MNLLFALTIFGIVFGSLIFNVADKQNQNNSAGETAALASNMLVYRNYVGQYAKNNPAVNASVLDTALNLPSWYSRFSGVNNYVSGGMGYVYYPTTNFALSYSILKLSNNSILAGIKTSGNLINPLSLTNYSTPIVLPTAIPDGAVVFMY